MSSLKVLTSTVGSSTIMVLGLIAVVALLTVVLPCCTPGTLNPGTGIQNPGTFTTAHNLRVRVESEGQKWQKLDL